MKDRQHASVWIEKSKQVDGAKDIQQKTDEILGLIDKILLNQYLKPADQELYMTIKHMIVTRGWPSRQR